MYLIFKWFLFYFLTHLTNLFSSSLYSHLFNISKAMKLPINFPWVCMYTLSAKNEMCMHTHYSEMCKHTFRGVVGVPKHLLSSSLYSHFLNTYKEAMKLPINFSWGCMHTLSAKIQMCMHAHYSD